MLKYFEDENTLNNVELARCLLQSHVAVHRAIFAIVQERRENEELFTDVDEVSQRKRMIEGLEHFIEEALEHGVIQLGNAGSLLHPLYHEVSDCIRYINTRCEGIQDTNVSHPDFMGAPKILDQEALVKEIGQLKRQTAENSAAADAAAGSKAYVKQNSAMQICKCGNVFMCDSQFCRKCGLARPPREKEEDVEDLSTTPRGSPARQASAAQGDVTSSDSPQFELKTASKMYGGKVVDPMAGKIPMASLGKKRETKVVEVVTLDNEGSKRDTNIIAVPYREVAKTANLPDGLQQQNSSTRVDVAPTQAQETQDTLKPDAQVARVSRAKIKKFAKKSPRVTDGRPFDSFVVAPGRLRSVNQDSDETAQVKQAIDERPTE